MKKVLCIFIVFTAVLLSGNTQAADVRNYGQWSQLDLMSQRVSYDSEGLVEYIGYALPGSPETGAVWMICKLSYDESGRFTSRKWAGGTDQRNKKWSERTSLTYE